MKKGNTNKSARHPVIAPSPFLICLICLSSSVYLDVLSCLPFFSCQHHQSSEAQLEEWNNYTLCQVLRAEDSTRLYCMQVRKEKERKFLCKLEASIPKWPPTPPSNTCSFPEVGSWIHIFRHWHFVCSLLEKKMVAFTIYPRGEATTSRLAGN